MSAATRTRRGASLAHLDRTTASPGERSQGGTNPQRGGPGDQQPAAACQGTTVALQSKAMQPVLRHRELDALYAQLTAESDEQTQDRLDVIRERLAERTVELKASVDVRREMKDS